ncbi:hypothetical protein BXA16_06335 [Salmonella enterica subsp. enterica serovar Typhimurium]|nr:hypothetical protein BXA16_06335 [Salmonella enterica subsp. enterica serovar Typhimurium]
MFLNTDTFNYGGHSIVLSELSALQRVDYLKFIQQRTADYDAQPETLTEAERQTEFMQMGVDINAWLVSRSLCESKKEEEARALYESVRLEWSYEALGRGADMVLSLSGMRLPASQEDDSGSEKDTTTPEKELGEWAEHFGKNSFSDMLLDAEFATLKSLISGLVTGTHHDAEMFSLITDPESLHEKTDDELMILGEGITGGVRYGPDSEPGH